MLPMLCILEEESTQKRREKEREREREVQGSRGAVVPLGWRLVEWFENQDNNAVVIQTGFPQWQFHGTDSVGL